MNGRHGDRSGLNFAVSGGKLLDGTKTATPELARHRRSPCRVDINDSDQSDWGSLVGELMVNAGVIAAKRAHTNHGDVDGVVRGQWSVLNRQLPQDLLI